MKYSPVEIEKMLDSIQIIVDTREHVNDSLKKRMEGFGRPSVRKALSYGDYSAQYSLPDGEMQTLENSVVIERKYGISEICTNFTQGRERFKREFEKAISDGAKIHIIIENATWEDIYAGRYRSKLNPTSLVASILAWCSRYNITLHFCRSESTGRLIADILHYSLREELINV